MPFRPEVLDLRQQHRQVLLGHGHDPALLAVDDRDRAAPVALAGEAPVAQAEADRRPAAPSVAEPLDDRFLRLLGRQPAELPRVDEHPVLVHDLADRQAVALGELTVALVVRGHGHDRAGAVVHQHVVGDPDRDRLVRRRVGGVEAGEDACLLLGTRALVNPLGQSRLHVLPQLVRVGRALGQRVHERMLGREHEEGRAEHGVRPRREDRHVDIQLVDPEEQLGALGAADPVALDRDRPLRPVEQLVILQQCVRVGGDPEEPLLHLANLDDGAAALAAAVDHLLVREHGLVDRAPVDRRLLAVGEALLEELQEEPLRPAVVLGLVRGEHAVPVDRPAQPAHLALDARDVALRDLARVAALLDRGVLGGQAERVVAHRAQDGQALAALEVRDDVAQRVVEDVPHVQGSRGVRQHLEHVELLARLGARLGVVDVEGPLVLPDALPLRLDCLGVVLLQPASRYEKASRMRGLGEASAAPPRLPPALLEKLHHHV